MGYSLTYLGLYSRILPPNFIFCLVLTSDFVCFSCLCFHVRRKENLSNSINQQSLWFFRFKSDFQHLASFLNVHQHPRYCKRASSSLSLLRVFPLFFAHTDRNRKIHLNESLSSLRLQYCKEPTPLLEPVPVCEKSQAPQG